MALMDPRQAAERLGCKPSTLAKKRVTGGFIPYILVGRSIKYDAADVEAYLASRKVGSTSEGAQLGNKVISTSKAA